MPSPERDLDPAGAARHVARRCVGPGVAQPEGAGTRLGLELEWITVDGTRPAHRFAVDELEAATATGGRLPAGSRVTIEPGGQVELSTRAGTDLEAALAAAAEDAAELHRRLGEIGVQSLALGADPRRRPALVLDLPRYEAMARAFDAGGPAGRRMMCNTAAIQLNLDLGADGGAARWQALDDTGPALAAAFANSPLADGRPTGWRSSRLAAWGAIDRTRTAAVALVDRAGSAGPGPADHAADPIDVVRRWSDYALQAQVLFVRVDEGRCPVPARGFTFDRWLAEGHDLGWPTLDDWDYHLTTLFPPIRPRGWFEVRYLDALGDDHWPVAAAAVWALAVDEQAGEAARDAAAPVRGWWLEAACHGPAHPEVAAAAVGCLDAAADGLDRLGHAARAEQVRAHRDRYPARGRCPADDVLDAHALGLFEPAEAVVEP